MFKRILNKLKRQPEYVPLRSKPLPVAEKQAFVDIHCHCLPGLDDGPRTLDESISLCRELVADGITSVVATPHQLGRYEGFYDADDIREAVADLNAVLEEQSVDLKVLAGADVRVDERLVSLIDEDKIMTLCDGRKYILLELPHESFIDISVLIDTLLSKGIRSILSHPERNSVIMNDPDIIRPWLQKKAILQITAGSLTGDFGSVAERVGWYYLKSNMASVVATDAHNTKGRGPRMCRAYSLIRNRLDERTANLLCINNPAQILAGGNTLLSLYCLAGR